MAYDYNPVCQSEVNPFAFISCINPVERSAMLLVRASVLAGVNFLPAQTLETVFQSASPLWWEKRLQAFLANWNVFLQVIELEPGEEIRGYVCFAVWPQSGTDDSVCPGRLGGGARCPHAGYGYPD